MQSNLSGEEWLELRALAADKTIVIKATGKGSSVIVLDRSGRLLNNFRIKNIYKDVKFNENILIDLVERSNKRLYNHQLISEK